jgi:hypothetical protein
MDPYAFRHNSGDVRFEVRIPKGMFELSIIVVLCKVECLDNFNGLYI